jgi:hypothetical protein
MKIVLSFFIVLTFLFLGCGEGREVSKFSLVYGYDFTKYTAQGFLFTPELYNGDYDAIGLIEISIYPEVRLNDYVDDNKYDTWHRKGQNERCLIGNVTSNEILDSLYNYTKKMGADAVTKLKISESESMSNGEILYTGIKASGFAIKRR